MPPASASLATSSHQPPPLASPSLTHHYQDVVTFVRLIYLPPSRVKHASLIAHVHLSTLPPYSP